MASSKERAQAAVRAIHALGPPNPLNNRETLIDGVLVDVREFDGQLWLSSIRALEKGKGAGSRVLDLILRIADKHGVGVGLIPSAYDRVTMRRLRRWYTRHGFRKDSYDPGVMVYKCPGCGKDVANNPEPGTYTCSGCRSLVVVSF